MIGKVQTNLLAIAAYCIFALLPHCRVNNNEHLMNVNPKGVILDAYDTVAFFTKRKALKGYSKFQVKYKGALFYFASEKNKKIFQTNPEKYAPQFGAWCAYAVSLGHVSPISVEFFKIQKGRLLFQHNQKASDLYGKEAKKNLAKAKQNWPDLLYRHRKGSYVAL